MEGRSVGDARQANFLLAANMAATHATVCIIGVAKDTRSLDDGSCVEIRCWTVLRRTHKLSLHAHEAERPSQMSLTGHPFTGFSIMLRARLRAHRETPYALNPSYIPQDILHTLSPK